MTVGIPNGTWSRYTTIKSPVKMISPLETNYLTNVHHNLE